MDLITEIRERLFAEQNLKYRDFQAKLMPGVALETIIGVRTPILRKLSKEYAKHPKIDSFLMDLPHQYYDENNLHGFILCESNDFDWTIHGLDRFLPYVNNWATCDLMRPKCFKKHRSELLPHIDRWMASGETYTVRFGIEMLMSFFLDDDFDITYLDRVAAVKGEEYYIKMMVAWYFATALAKQYDAVIPYIEEQKLQKWTHNKTIQKAVESFRITDEQKQYLRTLKIK